MEEKIRGISKALSIVAKVMKVFLIIGMVGLVLSLMVVPVALKTVTVTNNIDEEKSNSLVIISQNDDRISVKVGNVLVISNESLEDYEDLYRLLNSESKTSLIWSAEIAIFCALVMLVLFYLVMKYVDKLFDTIYKEKTPFVLDNVTYIRKITYLLAAYIVTSLVSSGIFEMITNREMDNEFSLSSVMLVLSLYVFSYIFEYGYSLENKKIKNK